MQRSANEKRREELGLEYAELNASYSDLRARVWKAMLSDESDMAQFKDILGSITECLLRMKEIRMERAALLRELTRMNGQ